MSASAERLAALVVSWDMIERTPDGELVWLRSLDKHLGATFIWSDLREVLADLDHSTAELARVNVELRQAGYEYPLGARGVHDMAIHLHVFRNPGVWGVEDEGNRLRQELADVRAELDAVKAQLTERPVQWVCTCNYMNAGPVCTHCGNVPKVGAGRWFAPAPGEVEPDPSLTGGAKGESAKGCPRAAAVGAEVSPALTVEWEHE
jgi:hypothetical protein